MKFRCKRVVLTIIAIVAILIGTAVWLSLPPSEKLPPELPDTVERGDFPDPVGQGVEEGKVQSSPAEQPDIVELRGFRDYIGRFLEYDVETLRQIDSNPRLLAEMTLLFRKMKMHDSEEQLSSLRLALELAGLLPPGLQWQQIEQDVKVWVAARVRELQVGDGASPRDYMHGTELLMMTSDALGLPSSEMAVPPTPAEIRRRQERLVRSYREFEQQGDDGWTMKSIQRLEESKWYPPEARDVTLAREAIIGYVREKYARASSTRSKKRVLDRAEKDYGIRAEEVLSPPTTGDTKRQAELIRKLQETPPKGEEFGSIISDVYRELTSRRLAPEIVQSLIVLVEDEASHTQVREMAASVLGRSGDKKARECVIGLLQREDDTSISLGTIALGERATLGKVEVSALEGAYRNAKGENIKLAIVEVLGMSSLRSATSSETLLRLSIEEKDPKLLAGIYRMSFKTMADGDLNQKRYESLWETLKSGETSRARLAVIGPLHRFYSENVQNSAAIIELMTTDPDPKVRAALINLVDGFFRERPEVKTALLQLKETDESAEVKQAAEKALKGIQRSEDRADPHKRALNLVKERIPTLSREAREMMAAEKPDIKQVQIRYWAIGQMLWLCKDELRYTGAPKEITAQLKKLEKQATEVLSELESWLKERDAIPDPATWSPE